MTIVKFPSNAAKPDPSWSEIKRMLNIVIGCIPTTPDAKISDETEEVIYRSLRDAMSMISRMVEPSGKDLA